MQRPADLTIVVDVGARYGMHPSWRDFDGELLYLAVEPDAEEAARLRSTMKSSPHRRIEVLEAALDAQNGKRAFHLLKHRGLSSFLKPDLTSECFRHLKPGQAEIERIIELETRRLDDLLAERGVAADFLKVDTEGTEQDVIEGAIGSLDRGVLGVRSSCNFQPCFHGQKLFSTTHDFLLQRGFILVNIDYRGFGYPRLGLFRKPDPIENEDFRYGILVAADAVWIRSAQWLGGSPLAATAASLDRAIAKLAYFCMLNNAPDLGVDLLRERSLKAFWSEEVRRSRLFQALRLRVAHFLGRWRTVPDEQWERARGIYKEIYKEALGGGSEFYPQVQAMAAELA